MSFIKDKKFILLIAGILIILPGWIFLAHLPITAQVRNLIGECALLNDEIRQKRVDIENIRAIYDEVNRLNLELDAVLNHLSFSDSIPEFIQNIKREMSEYGLTNIDIFPRLADLVEEKSIPLGTRFVNRVELQVQAEGGFIALGRYIEHIRKQPCFAGQSGLNIMHDPENLSKSKLSYSFFVLLENRS